MPTRCFIAVDLPSATRDLLGVVRPAVSEVDPRWSDEKWVRPEHLHVTLKFIGPLADAVLPEVVDALSASVGALPPFGLRLAGIRAVPGAHRARMLWATLTGDLEAAVVAHSRVECALAGPFGVEADARAYTPHITVVRARRPHRIDAAALDAADTLVARAGKGPDGYVSVSSLTLYASTLGRGGPFYRVITDLPFGGGGARHGFD
jgi:2'-5' RNA ligase